MKLKEGSVVYARIDHKAGGKEETEQDGQDCMAYWQNLAKERHAVAGIFGNMELGEMHGAMVLFEAKDMEEAQKIAQNDPIIARGFYRYELYRWNVAMVS